MGMAVRMIIYVYLMAHSRPCNNTPFLPRPLLFVSQSARENGSYVHEFQETLRRVGA